MIDRPDTRGVRDAEIAYAVTTSTLPALLLVVAAIVLGRWSGLAGTPGWSTAFRGWELLVAAGAILRVVMLLARFDARQRSRRPPIR